MSNLTIKDKLSELFVKWGLPTRQAALNDIMQLIESAITEARIDELEQLKKIRIKGTHHPNGEFDYMWAYAIPEDSLENRIKELKDNTTKDEL